MSGLRLCGVLAEDTPDYVDHRMPIIETPSKGTPGALVLRIEIRQVSRG